MAAPNTKPMYRLQIFDLEGNSLREPAEFSMRDLRAVIAEVMPAELQSNASISNSLASRGFYVRAGLDQHGLAVIVVITHLPK